MISLAEARARIQTKIGPLPPRNAPLCGTQGCVLREEVRAREDLPAFDRSAMDGYAVALEDDSTQFRVIGEIQPGVVPRFKISRGEAARIFTGAHIPGGASQVIMQEHIRREGPLAVPTQRNRMTHIRKQGEDARKGDLLLRSGERLNAGELALLASLGIVNPLVSPRVRVTHFTTGNELVDPSETPGPGQIRDANSALVAAFVRQFGGDLVRQERTPDNFDLLLQMARNTGEEYDLLLVSGGASVGDYDYGRKLLTALGHQIHFDKINLRPGRPLVFGTRDHRAAFILPGNPVSHFVALHVAVRLALELFSGEQASWPLAQIQLAAPLDCRTDPRETYCPARVTAENGGLVGRALRWQSSGDVTGLAGANALLQLTGATQALAAGSMVNALLLDLI